MPRCNEVTISRADDLIPYRGYDNAFYGGGASASFLPATHRISHLTDDG
jgi:hypothetical protein